MPYKDPSKQSAYQAEWARKRKEAWLLENGPCKICGSSENLQVDHVDPSTKITHRVWFWSKERRDRELAKCRVLCYVCHDKKSRKEKLRGEDQPRAKLTEAQVREILKLYAGGIRQVDLVARFGVDKSTICDIVNRKKWKHLGQ